MRSSIKVIKKCSQTILFSVYAFSFMLTASSCALTYEQMLLDAYEKEPAYFKNVTPGPPLAIDGYWKNPYIGYLYHMDRGRFIMLEPGGSGMPGFDLVQVKDIKQVAPGRYQGKKFETDEILTYSIVAENKIIERSYHKGTPIDAVYDMVSLKYRDLFLKEYQLFLKEIEGN